MEFGCSSESCRHRSIGATGITPVPPLSRRFRSDRCGFPSMQSPVIQRSTGSSSLERCSPSELSWLTPARKRFRTERLPWGLFPSSRRQYLESTSLGEFSQAHLRSAPSVSRTLDGFLLQVPCGSVSSRYHVQGSRFRGFLPRASSSISSMVLPLSPLASFSCRLHRLQIGARRPQGLIRPVIRNRLEGVILVDDPYPLVRFVGLHCSSKGRGSTRPIMHYE